MTWLGRQCLQLQQQYHSSENESYLKYIPITLGVNGRESLIFLIPAHWIFNHKGAGKSLMIAEYTKVLQRRQEKHAKVHCKWWPGYWYRNIRHISYILSMTSAFLIHYNFLFRASRDFSRKKLRALTLNSSYCIITEQEGWTTRGHLVHFSATYYSRVNCIFLKLFLKDWSKKPEHIASVGFSHNATEIITALWYLHDADGWNVNIVVKLWTFIIWSKTVGYLATHS